MDPSSDWLLLSPPHVSSAEREALLDAFDSGWIAPAGPYVEEFESEIAEYLGRPTVVLSSGTAALHLALVVAGVKPGDKVIVPSLTFAASAFPVTYQGATPIFVDSSLESWTIDPTEVRRVCSLLRSRHDARLRAVVAVDIYGQLCDYSALMELAEEFGFVLIADAAEALGSTYMGQRAGSVGPLAILSFNGNKIATAASGGALSGSDPDQISYARKLSMQAREPVPHYEHHDIGFNYRLSNLHAAIGRVQLGRINEMVERRRAIFSLYRERLNGLGWLSMMPYDIFGRSNSWLSCVLVHEPFTPASVIEHLFADRIEARRVWKPLHRQRAFKSCGTFGHLPVSDYLFQRGVCLPSGSGMCEDDIDRVFRSLERIPSVT